MNTTRSTISSTQSSSYAGDEARWNAVIARDEEAEGLFWFSVSTTGVYCYPSCAARRPRRENVAFYDTREAAERQGYRPCKRCRPDLPPRRVRHAEAVAKACKLIEEAEEEPSLEELAAAVGLSASHFHRLFKKIVGLTPKRYALAQRARRVRSELQDGGSVTDSIYEAGFSSSSRFYEKSEQMLGMQPGAYAKGGRDQHIRWDVAESWLGPVLVAATERGICSVLFGKGVVELEADLSTRFPRAVLERAEPGSDFADWLAGTVAFLELPSRGWELPLDVSGTAFQQRVWTALREIPAGETASYGEVARRIGKPTAARAVAGACGANPVAVAIPCHRVVGSQGSLGGYRWGTDRKARLLERESRS